MDKKTKTILAVGVLAAVGYFIWKQNQQKSFANLLASPELGELGQPILVEECGMDRTTGNIRKVDVGGLFPKKVYQCCGDRQKYAFNRPSQDCVGPSVAF